MKPCSAIVALGALFFSSSSFGEEKPAPIFTALSSTTISGYVSTSEHWRRHVCRPLRPVRVHRLYKLSNGVIRQIGYTVRCRHGTVYLPNGRIAELLPAPNRSSRFASHGSTPRIDDRTAVFLLDGTILIEAHRVIQWPPRPGRPLPPPPFPPLPPLPPTPLYPTNRPPPIFGGGFSGSISQRYQVSSELQRLPVTFNPELRGAIQEPIQLQEYRDVPHGTNLDARWLRMDRRPLSQPPDRFVRELR